MKVIYNSDFFSIENESLHSVVYYFVVNATHIKPFDKVIPTYHKINFLSILNDIGL